MTARHYRRALALVTVCLLAVGVAVVMSKSEKTSRTTLVAYFDNTNGIYVGDEVRILGVPVGEIERIEPQPDAAKVTFWVDDKYKVPADAKAAILSPSLVTARAIQLVPAYTGGPTLGNGAVIPRNRTIVPVEWDDLRDQLKALTDSMQPTVPGGVSSLGALINTTADNLRGRGAAMRQALIGLSQSMSILGDHSADIFSTVRQLATLVTALQSSREILSGLNQNLAAVTGLLANDDNEIGQVVSDLNTALNDVGRMVKTNSDAVGIASDKLSSISSAIKDSLGDIKQTLHIVPTGFSNFLNTYNPTNQATTGGVVLNNFANPITFICGAIQAASRLNAEQAAKLCVQYLAPIVKNRQYNFPPLGLNTLVGTQARPNELTYSEDWLRPDYMPPPSAASPSSPPPVAADPAGIAASLADAAPPLAAETPGPQPVSTDPSAGLPGIMLPTGQP